MDIKVPVFKSGNQVIMRKLLHEIQRVFYIIFYVLSLTQWWFVFQLPEIKPYMDYFPFPFYIILRDINSLPHVLCDALRQWFELVTAVDMWPWWFMCDLLTVMGCLNAESVVQTGGVLHVCGSLNWWHWCVNIVTYYITVLHYYVMLCGVFEPDSVVSRAVKSYVRLHGTGLRSWWKWINDFPCIFYDFFKHLTSFWNIWMKFCSHLDRCVFCW